MGLDTVKDGFLVNTEPNTYYHGFIPIGIIVMISLNIKNTFEMSKETNFKLLYSESTFC